jgi:hypothetical protein
MLQCKNEVDMARACQGVKAIETSVVSHGRWSLAWLYAGLEDPRSRLIDLGLARPEKFATDGTYLKAMQTVHTALGEADDADDGSGGGFGASAGTGPGQGESGAGAGGYSRAPGHANNAECHVNYGCNKGGGDCKEDRCREGKPAGGSTGSPPAGN